MSTRNCVFFLCLKIENSLSESSDEISWSLLDTMTVSSHSFCQTWCMHSAVKGFRSEKDMISSVGFLSRASLAVLPAASFSRIPTCPGTHTKTISFWSTSILCNRSCICIDRRSSVLIFPTLAKWIVNLKQTNKQTKNMTFLRLVCLFEGK